jgi:predicted AlkP superfamily phosphohydrolase/phosphomutase
MRFMGRLCIVGLDCLTPQLAFDRFAHRMPTLEKLREGGIFGLLESSVPPITVPAWACMTTGYPPSRLGIYGFRDRKLGSYTERHLANCLSHDAPYLWDRLSDANKQCLVLSVPLTWPARPLEGKMITGFLTPEDRQYASYPPDCLEHAERKHQTLAFDVDGFRSGNHAEILESCIALSTQQTNVFCDWLQTEKWDFAMRVDMGPDRMHHALWGAMQGPTDHPFKDAMGNYYELLDNQLAQVASCLSLDDTLMVVSDHGAQTMEGAIALNQWLIDEGLLKLHRKPTQVESLDPKNVDWEGTKAWAAGGYVGRIYLNLRGRESQGTLEPHDAEVFVDDLLKRFTKLRTLANKPIEFKAHRPTQDWKDAKGDPPDVILEIENYRYRALGTVGYTSSLQRENDYGEDGANHARHGVFVMKGPHTRSGEIQGATLYDIAPTVCSHFDLNQPEGWSGRVLK